MPPQNNNLIAIIVVCIIIAAVLLIYTNNSNNQTEPMDAPKPETPPNEIVLFYAMWCGYSRQFLPEWEKFECYAKANFPNLKVTRMLCEGDKEAICHQKGTKGYPTVILYLANGASIQYTSERSVSGLTGFINQHVKM